MAPARRDDHSSAIFIQPAQSGCIRFTDLFVWPKQRAIQVNGAQSIREIRSGLIVVMHHCSFRRGVKVASVV
jgi:hypothetical protein